MGTSTGPDASRPSTLVLIAQGYHEDGGTVPDADAVGCGEGRPMPVDGVAIHHACCDDHGREAWRFMNYSAQSWMLDEACVLPRGRSGAFDSAVSGDPCIVWDGEIRAWRMFYFCGDGETWTSAQAISRSAEEVAAGDWTKSGRLHFTNPEDLASRTSWHKWWVCLDPCRHNHAASIDGRFWAFYTSCVPPHKVIQAAWADRLSGPWTVVPQPILAPDRDTAPDGLHCDTPTAYWFEERNAILIYYMAYPKTPQPTQPNSPWGSSILGALYRPGAIRAEKGKAILSPGAQEDGRWAGGWCGGLQLLRDRDRWYGLLNAGPTPPSHDGDWDGRSLEPRPSLGGWAFCDRAFPDAGWRLDVEASPLLHPDDLSGSQRRAGLGVNFWRHHLLVTERGAARIYVNSGPYGREQMYSFLPETRRHAW